MTVLKFNIIKKITLGLSTIICTCALYSNANAHQKSIDNDGIIIFYEQTPIDVLSVNSNTDNIPNYNLDKNTDEIKESTIKWLFKKKSTSKEVFAVVGIAVALGLVLTEFRQPKVHSKDKENKEQQIENTSL